MNISTTDASGTVTNTNINGIVDLDARILMLAYGSKRLLIAPGIEATFNTATNNGMGFGKTVLAPMVFFGFPGILGKGNLFVPGYQYLFSVGGDENRPDVSRSQIDLYFVWLLPKGGNWLIVNPQ